MGDITMKKILLASFIGAMLLFSGCSNTDGENRLAAQKMLDSGDYAGVISALESQSDTNATDVSENMILGSAYMGVAGLSSAELFSMMAGTATTPAPAPSLRSTRAAGDDAFATFADEIAKNAANNPRVIEYLEKAIKMFKKVEAAAPNTKNAKLYLGLSQVAKATTTFTYLGDIAKMIENGVDDELVASACAIIHIYAPSAEGNLADCVSTVIVANNPDTNASLYNELKVTLSNARGDFRRLITADGNQVVITDGYIDVVDGNDTNESNNGANSARPVQDETLTIESALLSALNDGFDLIIEIAPSEILDDITAYRNGIDVSGDGVISAQEMAEYIDGLVDKTII